MDLFTRNKTKFELFDAGRDEAAIVVTMLGKLADELGSKGHQGAETMVRQLAVAVIRIEEGRKR
jgi:hypothetical protein